MEGGPAEGKKGGLQKDRLKYKIGLHPDQITGRCTWRSDDGQGENAELHVGHLRCFFMAVLHV